MSNLPIIFFDEESSSTAIPHTPRSVRVSIWTCRVCFAIVFVVNVQCALGYAINPAVFMAGFQLGDFQGAVAVQGLGIAFLMWNATYPAFIVNPQRFKVLGVVILIQQVIGLIGESAIYFSLPAAGFAQLAQSIERFIAFDALGLVLMAASFCIMCLVAKKRDRTKR